METNSAQFFLSNLSHEIRTPLNGIFGYTQLLTKTKLDKTQKMYLDSVNHCCIQLVELVNDILDFSKLTSGKAQVNNECFSFKEVIQEIESAIGYRIKEKRQKCRYIVDKAFPEYIITDKQKLTQILINLISNANKFTPQNGRIIVSISTKEDYTIQCTVEDNGIGISLEDQKKLFNPFVQVQESLTKNGSGLGLAISKSLVELLGGTISLESEKGHGSVFTFSLKYEPYERFQKYVEKNSEVLKGKYILISDSDVDNRLLLAEILFDYGIRPIVCSSSKETLRMLCLKRYPFSCALIDLSMSDSSGSDLAKQIREIDPEIPMIALSSVDEGFDSSSFEYVVSKPIEKVKLLDILSRTVNKNDVGQFQLNEVVDKPAVPKREIKILIAEDISYNSDMLIKMLNSMGYKDIDTVQNGEEAVERIDKRFSEGKPYDILLLDLKMPKLDGFGVAEHVKMNNYSFPKIAVITASVLETDRERCRDIGIKYFLLKPFNMTHLKTVVNKILHGSGNFIK